METDVEPNFSSWFNLLEDQFHNFNENHYGEKNFEEMPAFSSPAAPKEAALSEFSGDGSHGGGVESPEKKKKKGDGKVSE